MLDASSGRVEDVNQAAAQLLGTTPDALSGTPFAQEFEDRRQAEFMDALNGSASSGSGRSVIATSRRNGRHVNIYPTLFRAAGRTALLCRLESSEAGAAGRGRVEHQSARPLQQGAGRGRLHRHSGADPRCERGFPQPVRRADGEALNGKSLGDFLARGGADLKIMIDNASRWAGCGPSRPSWRRRWARSGLSRSPQRYLNDRAEPAVAFVFRDMSAPRARPRRPQPRAAPTSLATSWALSAPPRSRTSSSATADVVEKICIETAVQLHQQQPRRRGRDARAFAAEPLREAPQVQSARQVGST